MAKPNRIVPATLLVALLVTACAASIPPSATYGVRLEECNRNAKTRAESEACEDALRAEYKRPPRDAGVDR